MHEELTEKDLRALEQKYPDADPIDVDVRRLVAEVRWLRDQCIKTAGDLAQSLVSQSRFAQQFQRKLKEAADARTGV